MNNRKRNQYISSPARTRLPSKRRKSKFWANAKRFVQTYKSSILIVVIIVLLSIITRLSYGYTIGKDANVIHEITFTDESVQMYDNKDMYNEIRKELDGKNVVLLKLKNGGDAKNTIQAMFPFIDDMKLTKTAASTVSVELDFHPADLVFFNTNVRIAYANKFLFPVNEPNQILSGALQIELPAYFSGESITQNATGYIALIGPEKIKNDFAIIQDAMPVEHVLFLAGSQKSIVTAGNKRITFDHKRSISAQVTYLQQLVSLDPSFYYDIDLATYPKVIIKKTEGGF